MSSESAGSIGMLDLAAEVDALWPELQPAVERVLRSGRFVGGPDVAAFEEEAAAYLGVRHAVGLNSGTDALIIALEALGVGPGDEVITTPFSFFATAEAILRLGATPVFGDIDPVTLNLDPASVAPLVTPRTRAILPVHLFGLPAAMTRLQEIASAHGLALVEDAAQAFGAGYSGSCVGCDGACSDSVRNALAGRRVGALGTVAAFSFYPTKTLGAYGDAGMLTTDDDALAETAQRLRNHGSRPDAKYVSDFLGHNSRLDSIQAAILRVKLRHLDAATEARRSVARRYHDLLSDVDAVELPPLHPDHVFHQFTVQLPTERRQAIADALSSAAIANQHFYPLPLGSQPVFRGDRPVPPVTAAVCNRAMSLPVHPGMRDEDVERVARVLRSAL